MTSRPALYKGSGIRLWSETFVSIIRNYRKSQETPNKYDIKYSWYEGGKLKGDKDAPNWRGKPVTSRRARARQCRVVQLNYTQEMEVFCMLFNRAEHFLFVPICLLWYLSKSMSNTVYFNFRCKIQLYHPVLQPKNTVLSPTTNSLLALWPRRPGVVHVCAVKKGVEEIRSSDLGMGSTLIGDGSRFIRR